MFTTLLIAGALAAAPDTDIQQQSPPRDFGVYLDAMMAEKPEFAAIIDQMEKEMLARGDAEQGWNEQGVDLAAYFAERGATFASHVLVDPDEELPSLWSLEGAVDSPAFAYSMGIAGEEERSRDNGETYIRLADGIYLRGAGGASEIGTAYCQEGGDFDLVTNRDPEGWGEEDWMTVVLLGTIVRMMEEVEFCSVMSVREDGSLTDRFYDREGRPFTLLNSEAASWELRERAAATEAFFAD